VKVCFYLMDRFRQTGAASPFHSMMNV